MYRGFPFFSLSFQIYYWQISVFMCKVSKGTIYLLRSGSVSRSRGILVARRAVFMSFFLNREILFE